MSRKTPKRNHGMLRLDALNAQNDAIEQQIELEQLQANLAMARNKKVIIVKVEDSVMSLIWVRSMTPVKELDEFNRRRNLKISIAKLESLRFSKSKL